MVIDGYVGGFAGTRVDFQSRTFVAVVKVFDWGELARLGITNV